MNVFERIAVERPRLRLSLLAAIVLALAAYIAWRAVEDPAGLVAAGAAAMAGAGLTFLFSRADRRIYHAGRARALRLGRHAASTGAVVGAVVAAVTASRVPGSVPVALCGFLIGALAVAAFVYPLPAALADADRGDG